MSQSPIVYEASVFSSTVSYKNFLGEEKSVELNFSLHPLKLMHLISTFVPKKIKSGNPARNGQVEITDDQQIKFLQDVAKLAAGTASEDGENWLPYPEFETSLAGQAFLTKLTSSDGDRKEFSEKVLIDPFRAFVGFARVDSSNTAKDIQMLEGYLMQMENIFRVPEQPAETPAERRARLQAELDAISDSGPAEGTQGDNGINSPGNR